MHSQRLSYERTLLDLSLKLEDCLLYTQRYIFVCSLCWFFSVQIQSPFFAFLERDLTLLSCVSTDGNTADILMLMLMLMHDRFTHATKHLYIYF